MKWRTSSPRLHPFERQPNLCFTFVSFGDWAAVVMSTPVFGASHATFKNVR